MNLSVNVSDSLHTRWCSMVGMHVSPGNHGNTTDILFCVRGATSFAVDGVCVVVAVQHPQAADALSAQLHLGIYTGENLSATHCQATYLSLSVLMSVLLSKYLCFSLSFSPHFHLVLFFFNTSLLVRSLFTCLSFSPSFIETKQFEFTSNLHTVKESGILKMSGILPESVMNKTLQYPQSSR